MWKDIQMVFTMNDSSLQNKDLNDDDFQAELQGIFKIFRTHI